MYKPFINDFLPFFSHCNTDLTTFSYGAEGKEIANASVVTRN